MHYLRLQQLAQITGQTVNADGTVTPIPTAAKNEALAAQLAALPQVFTAMLQSFRTGYVDPALQAQFQAIVGGTSPQAFNTLKEVMEYIATDTSAGAALLAQQNADRARIATAEGNVATVANALLNKASATDLTNVQTALNGKAPAAAIATLQTAIDGKLSKAGDTATGPIMVPTATTAAAAPRLDQTYGGLNSPIRFITGVGATAQPLQPGPLTDPTPQGRVAKPYLVILTMRTAPTVGLNVTINVGTTPGGAQVFTKTYLTTGLPSLNALLAPMQPAFMLLPAGTTLYAQATGGTWDVEVLSYYKS